MDNQEIVDFLIKAKKSTYASNGDPIKSSRPCSIDLSYSQGKFMYYDSYFGTNPFIGEELLLVASNAVWSMNYIGRKLDDKFQYDFFFKRSVNECYSRKTVSRSTYL